MNNEDKILSMLETIAVEQQKTNQRLDNLEQEVQSVKQDGQSVKDAVIRIENEHGDKLNAIFDSYGQLYDLSKEIRQDIATIKVEQEAHELHIKWLDAQREGRRAKP